MSFDRSVVQKTFGPMAFGYDWQQAALYALAVGARESELELLLETSGPKVLPTFSVVVALGPIHEAIQKLGGNMLTLVHGAQRCTVHRPLPPRGQLMTTATVRALYDKGKGALAVFETRTLGEDGEPLCDTEWQIYYRGEGGFGGERGPDAPAYEPPAGKAPDQVIEMSTRQDQALLYRLASQDMNPIHSDPAVAQMAGFPAPILHGLCTFGHAGRAAVQALCGGDATKLRSIEGRFSKPVFPGETIVTELWRVSEQEAYYQTKVKERAEVVISLGRALTLAP